MQLPRQILGLIVLAASLGGLRAAERPNVLFIAIDDLRNDLGVLGVEHAQTPHLDRLARSSRLFTHHYVQVPTCGASRCALLRGQYPDVKAQVSNNAIKETHAEWGDRSLPAWWRQHGYRTYSLGKITHYPGGLTGGDWNVPPEELPGAWDRSWIPDSPWKTSLDMMHGYANGKPRERGVTPPWEAVDESDHAYPDAWVADNAIAQLQTLAKSEEPWFFAVGFFKPHLPFAAPRKWLDMHDPADFPAPTIEANATARPGWHDSGELHNGYNLGGRDPFENGGLGTELRRAYAGSISYMDEQVGRVMAQLDALNLADNTIVVVWSDHGFLLGEHGIWAKHTLYEKALQSPMMIRMPGLKAPGAQADSVVETVDIYPTLLELCGLPSPGELDGKSLMPQLSDPEAKSTKPALGFWKDWRTVRNERWRLTVYPDDKDGNPVRELVDLKNDPLSLRDVAAENPQVVERLMKRLRPVLSK